MQIPIVGPTYTNDSRVYDAQRCVNFYPEVSEATPLGSPSKAPSKLVGCAGLELFATAGNGPVRGGIVTASGKFYVVSGNTVYEISTLGVATSLGTIDTSIGIVRMAENGTHVGIVDGTQGYYITIASDSLAQITDANFPDDATVIDFQDTYFIVNDPDTGDFYISANNDVTSWSATDKASVESSPDNLVSLISDHGELVLAGSRSMEVYYNSGDANFPFDRISQAVLQVGCGAAHTLKSFDNNVMWLSEDDDGGRFIYQLSGAYRAVRVSNVAVETALEGVADISGAYAWVYKQRGHEFYCLQVPSLNTTWVFDASTRM